jgi:hypothetical protein
VNAFGQRNLAARGQLAAAIDAPVYRRTPQPADQVLGRLDFSDIPEQIEENVLRHFFRLGLGAERIAGNAVNHTAVLVDDICKAGAIAVLRAD